MNAADLLLDTARRGELHHSVILAGPHPAVLKALAIRLAKTLNCLQQSTGDACLSCQKIDRRLHPDVHFVEVSADRKMISIDQIRDLVAASTLRPFEGRNKVFLIDPADAISVGGSNALLKTLEEPASDTVFVMMTRSPDLLLPTIRSRSQSIFIGESAPPRIGAKLGERRIEQVTAFGAGDDRESLARDIDRLLARFAGKGDSMALLGLASLVAAQDATKEAMALVAVALTSEDGAAASIDRGKRLAAADAILAAIRAMAVNADARLVMEGAMAKLV